MKPNRKESEKRKLVLASAFLRFLFLWAPLLAACANAATQSPPARATETPLPPSPAPSLAPPDSPPLAESPLKESILRAGDYLIRQQLPNGELSYQVNLLTGERGYSPALIRLMGGTGALYSVCRVSQDMKYCQAGDWALKHYLRLLVRDESKFKGACLYAEGYCPLGGAALTIDAIYKRWQASGSVSLDEENLLDTAVALGDFIVSLKKPQGGLYHAFDPHAGGMADADYFVASFPGESLLALLDLYEMTGETFWLTQAREINAFMTTQPVAEDQWHAYAFAKWARLDSLTRRDLDYAEKIAEALILGGVRSLRPQHSSASAASKLEGLAALAQAFALSGRSAERLEKEIPLYITFVRARQLPENDCGWTLSPQARQLFDGGVYASCEDPSIRVDAPQNWINGLTAYLEYLGMKR